MVHSRKIKKLEKEREGLKEEFLGLLDKMAIIFPSSGYYKCGNSDCKRCRGGGKSQGPFFI